jgi:hypothetical protein
MSLKRRTREHIIADLSSNFVERQVLLCGFTAERFYSDYGIDLTIRTYNEHGEVEDGFIFVQLKATERLKQLKKDGTIPWRIDARDLQAWLNEPLPYVLIVYDVQKNVAYWLYIQAFFAQKAEFDIKKIGQSVTVHLQPINQVNPESVKKFAQYKNAVTDQIRGAIVHDE